MKSIRELLEDSEASMPHSPELRVFLAILTLELKDLEDEFLVEVARVVITAIACRMSGVSYSPTYTSVEVHERALIDTLDCLKRSVSNEFHAG